MQNKAYTRFCFFSLLSVLLASIYPIYMGCRVVSDMLRSGTVCAETYPKYIIPYTPISLALIVGVALMPLLLRFVKGHPQLAASALCVAVFFTAELLLENLVIVTETIQTTLGSWQMFMCWTTPEMMGIATEVSILLGQYSPAFKLHFYLISLVLILSVLNCFYGLSRMLLTGDRNRLNTLILQSISSAVFLGLCILACFTAFFRTGEIQVSAVSAVLMCVFFVVFGVTSGIYTGSFLLEKGAALSVLLPAAVGSSITLVMYIGEMILLSGHLYRFGTGLLFNGIPGIVLAPIDILVILLSGLLTAGIMALLRKK